MKGQKLLYLLLLVATTLQLKGQSTITGQIKDQFGEMSGKKYGSRRFKQWLKLNQSESLTVWQKRIAATFHLWRGREEQVDDVCVIGVKI